MRRKILAALVCAAAVAAVAASGASAAGPTECNNVYSNTTFKGGLVVNEGDFCVLDHVTVNGGLTVNGGTSFNFAVLLVANSRINGGWSMTGDVFTFDPFCGNNINGGLNVHDVEELGFFAMSFGELNADCAGGRINGGASFTNVNSAGVELDGYLVNGGVTFANDTGFNELEATTVHGSASCDAFSNVQNDNSGPGNNANSYTGTNNGCPA